MNEQNHSNHGRFIPLWHYITGTLVIAVAGGSIVNFLKTDPRTHYLSALMVVVAFILASLFWYARWFALRAQDRAIRAEENFRHYILTGKVLDSRLRLGQVIALRFAGDDEMAALAKKAAEENLSNKQIKGMIKNWRADYHRV